MFNNINLNFDTQKKLILILLLCIFVIYLSTHNENFDTSSPISTTPTQENINHCDSESLDSCDVCKSAYDNYNLYPSTNSFVVRGNDINMNFKNNITDPVVLSDMGTKNYQVLNNIVKDYNPHSDESTKSAFDEVLKSAPLKTGCCFRAKDNEKERTVLVRIPLKPNESVDPLLKKFDFNFKTLKIPENSCPVNYYGGSNECNTFFDVYCKNLVNEFTKLNLPLENFTKFAPECACYAPKTDVENVYPPTTPPACYKTNCDNVIDPIAYIDPISRNNPCDLTICNNIFNANNIQAGGNVNISAKLESACGKNLPDKNNTGGSSSGGSSSGGSSSGGSSSGGSSSGGSSSGGSSSGGSSSGGSSSGDSTGGDSNINYTQVNNLTIIIIIITIILIISLVELGVILNSR